MISLKALAKRNAESRGEVRALAVCLVPTAPARVSEDVDIRAKEAKALVHSVVALANELMVLRPSFVGYDSCNLKMQRFIEHGSEANGLGEYRRDAGASHAVKPLVPPIVRWHGEARDPGRFMQHLS